MKRIITILTAAFAISLISLGCDNFLGGDTNIDPTRVSSDEVSPQELLPTALYYTSQAHFNIAFTSGQYSQQIATYFEEGTDSQQESSMNSAWVNIYLNALNNLEQMEKRAEEDGYSHYLGITKVLQAINLQLVTSTWEAGPFEAAYEEGDYSPSYDTQEQLYNTIDQLLTDAITELEKNDDSMLLPGQDDLIYGGDISKWLKTAYTLKARIALHHSNKSSFSPQDVLDALNNAYTENDDDLLLTYNSKNLNPWHTSVALANQTGNNSVLFSEQLVNAMNGERYGVMDPRLPLIADNGDTTVYFGGLNGTPGLSSISPDGGNADFGVDSWYSSASSPIMMLTYAEAKFIEAEAAFLRDNGGDELATGGSADAYTAYMEGIEAHMDRIGVSTTEKEAYLTDPAVAVGQANLTMELIMNEKNKALLLNPEAWNDLRRYDYSDQIFRDLTLPENHLLNGEWIQRAVYPSSEFSRNENEVRKVEKGPTEKMWIFQES